MKSTAVWESDERDLADAPTSESESSCHFNTETAENKLQLLKQMTFRLLDEMQSLTEVRALNIDGGLDFYEEVRRYEIDLITRALLRTGGHQIRAARLLNLKVTTLNSKIKHYKINPESLAQGRPFAVA